MRLWQALATLALVAGCVNEGDSSGEVTPTPSAPTPPVSVDLTLPEFGAPSVVVAMAAFEPSTLVDGLIDGRVATRRASEPSVALAPDGTVYVAAPACRVDVEGPCFRYPGAVWRSDDAGASFIDVSPLDEESDLGNQDSTVFVDERGILHVLDLAAEQGIPYYRSENKGATWNKSFLIEEYRDRQWIHGDGDATLVATWVSREDPGLVEFVKSHDSGLSWTPAASTQAYAWIAPSRIHVADASTYRFAYFASSTPGQDLDQCLPRDLTLYVAQTNDGGATWTQLPTGYVLSQRGEQAATSCFGVYIFPTLAVDRAGGLHVAWSQIGTTGPAVLVVSSADAGATWGAPTTLSAAGQSAIMPWVSAGEAGRVMVSYYRSAAPGDPNASPGPWYLEVAASANAGADDATWERTLVLDEPIHLGTVCTSGGTCAVNDRTLGDFFETTVGPDGSLSLVWTMDTPAPTRGTQLMYAKQSGGLPLLDART